jgi:hypothetical protein
MPGSSAKRSEATSAEKELTFMRVVDAPREVVFKDSTG